jgi:Asp-tRNA(Asn)/Glu-tRNA(Gln) amidotransferase A subunit family amidase
MSKVKVTFLAVVLSLVAVAIGLQYPQFASRVEAAQAQPAQGQAQGQFHLVEATIDDVHRAIRAGQITCRQLVQWYFNRAKAYNGVTNQLVTRDGRPIPPPAGVVRAGAPLKFPTETVAITTLVPNFDQYIGPPIEFGRMEATASDPEVQQQFGMTVGMPNVAQTNSIGTFNIRGERSVTCKGDRDKHPSAGALPAGSPPVCEEFRKQPDALERAAELDSQFGRNPNLEQMPLYCIPFSFKDPFDTKDMRTTAAGDARYDIDFPARDHTVVAELRDKGAIIYAKAVNTEYNGSPGKGGRHEPTMELLSGLGYQRSTWGGNPSSAYDSTRAASLGSSSGSAVSVSANLTMCSICEETSMSCRGPANHNSVALILPHKAMISMLGGGIGADIYNDRAGIHCRWVGDSAKVLDALKDPETGYYDPRDVFTTVPRSSLPAAPLANSVSNGARGSLQGLRIGVIRESMLKFPGIKADEPIVDAAVAEIKAMLRDHLGATLVESVDPVFPDDPSIPNMNPTYSRALAELVPVFFPEIMFRLQGNQPMFPEVAAAVKPTEFAPGRRFGAGTMRPIDYLLELAEGRQPAPRNLNIRTIQNLPAGNSFTFHVNQYLSRRAADWKARGFTETLNNFTMLNQRSKFWGDDMRAAFKNWEEAEDMRDPFGARQAIDEHIRLRELLRRLEMKVMMENRLDVVVRLHYQLPPGLIGLAGQPGPRGDTRGEIRMGPYAGVTEILIPAGYVRTVYNPSWALSEDKRSYNSVANNDRPTTMPAPGMPFSLVFRAEPGREEMILKVASAYQAASKRRVSPPKFPALAGEP